jgi:integrase
VHVEVLLPRSPAVGAISRENLDCGPDPVDDRELIEGTGQQHGLDADRRGRGLPRADELDPQIIISSAGAVSPLRQISRVATTAFNEPADPQRVSAAAASNRPELQHRQRHDESAHHPWLAGVRELTLAAASARWLADLNAGHIKNRSGDAFKPAAIRAYEKNLRLRVLPALGHLRLREVTTRDVQRLVDALVRDDLAPATVDSTLTPLRALYRHAVARGEAQTNPARGVEKPAVRCKLKRIASPTEAAKLLDVLPPEHRTLWATAFYAGLRRGELVALRWADVDLATGVIHVCRGWDPKLGEIAPKSRKGIRDVPIPVVLRDYLVEQRMNGGEGRVVDSDRQVRTIAEGAAKLWREHGLSALTLHAARHTYASLMVAAGVNAKALSTFMGHATVGITLDLYGHLLPGSEAEAADLLDAFLAREAGGTVAQTVAHPEEVA